MFEDELDRLSSAVYIIDGSLADPEVRFDRLFDNKTEEKTNDNVEIEADKTDTNG